MQVALFDVDDKFLGYAVVNDQQVPGEIRVAHFPKMLDTYEVKNADKVVAENPRAYEYVYVGKSKVGYPAYKRRV